MREPKRDEVAPRVLDADVVARHVRAAGVLDPDRERLAHGEAQRGVEHLVDSERRDHAHDRQLPRIHDIRASRNGTLVNFEPIPTGGSAALRHGAVVSAGRTHLVFRDP